VFLPQLLRYPNPSDPLNAKAAYLMKKNIKLYNEKVGLYIEKYSLKPKDLKRKCVDKPKLNGKKKICINSI